jgi:hypothetical protein
MYATIASVVEFAMQKVKDNFLYNMDYQNCHLGYIKYPQS